MSSNNIKNIDDAGVSHEKKGKAVQLGPIDKTVEPFTSGWASIQVEHNNPYLMVLSLNRTMYISHWADDILIEESYDLRHEGAR